MGTESDAIDKAVSDFMSAINDLVDAIRAAREANVSPSEIHRVMMEAIPEESRPAFAPLLPMLAALQ